MDANINTATNPNYSGEAAESDPGAGNSDGGREETVGKSSVNPGTFSLENFPGPYTHSDF